jgi:WD40 repeat protein
MLCLVRTTKTIKVWSLAKPSAKCVATLEGHTGRVASVTVTQDGQHIVSTSWDNTVRVWKLDGSGHDKEVRKIVHPAMVNDVAVTPDDLHIVSACDDHVIRVFGLADGQQLAREIQGHTDNVRCVVVSPDGQYIVSGSKDKTVRVWLFASGALVHEITGFTDGVWSVAVSPDSKHIISEIGVHSLASGTLVQNRRFGCFTICVSRQQIVSTSGSTVKVQSLTDDDAPSQSLEGHTEYVWGVAISADSTCIASASRDKSVRLWRVSMSCVLCFISLLLSFFFFFLPFFSWIGFFFLSIRKKKERKRIEVNENGCKLNFSLVARFVALFCTFFSMSLRQNRLMPLQILQGL